MTTPHRTQYLSYLEEATRGTDPITGAGDVTYQFGLEKNPVGNFPGITVDPHVTYYGDSREPGDQHVASYEANGNLVYCPSNGIPWYMFLGKSTSVNDVHTIEVLDSGELPTSAIRKETANVSENLRYNFLYSKYAQLDFGIDLQNKQTFAGMSHILRSKRIVEASGYSIAPSFPGSNEDPYRWSSNLAFTWDQGGVVGQVSMEDQLNDIMYSGINSLAAELVQGQNYANWLLEGNYFHAINLTVKRGSSKRFFTDLITSLSSDTFYDCRFKIFQTTTKYLQLDFTSCMILDNKINKAFEAKKEPTVYRVQLLPKTLVIECKDGIDPTSGAGDHYQRDVNYA